MKMKNLFPLLFIAMLFFGITMAAVEVSDAAPKVKKVKVTWDANGGKIGTKKVTTTPVKKGAKVAKLPTPKRTGYTFNGWYTKKSGGTKIIKATKIKKNVIAYAQWKKVSSTDQSKLLGLWWNPDVNGASYSPFTPGGSKTFKSGGAYEGTLFISRSSFAEYKGTYSISNGILSINQTGVHTFNGRTSGIGLMKGVYKYSFGQDAYGEYVLLTQISFENSAGTKEGAQTEGVKYYRVNI